MQTFTKPYYFIGTSKEKLTPEEVKVIVGKVEEGIEGVLDEIPKSTQDKMTKGQRGELIELLHSYLDAYLGAKVGLTGEVDMEATKSTEASPPLCLGKYNQVSSEIFFATKRSVVLEDKDGEIAGSLLRKGREMVDAIIESTVTIERGGPSVGR